MATAGADDRPRRQAWSPSFAALLPELVMGITPEQLAMVAARALTPKARADRRPGHLHAPAVSVREQAALIVDRLRRDARRRPSAASSPTPTSTLVVVARFLALLELFREAAIAFEQAEALGELTVRWTGPDEGEIEVERRVRRADDRTSRRAWPATAPEETHR